jgi:hypothetical protein
LGARGRGPGGGKVVRRVVGAAAGTMRMGGEASRRRRSASMWRRSTPCLTPSKYRWGHHEVRAAAL